MSVILGKWFQKEGQPYPGLWFEFKQDGTFEGQYESMGIVSSGMYAIEGDQITMQQTAHTLGFVGEFKGLFAIEGDDLKLALASGPGKERPEDLSDARLYSRK